MEENKNIIECSICRRKVGKNDSLTPTTLPYICTNSNQEKFDEKIFFLCSKCKNAFAHLVMNKFATIIGNEEQNIYVKKKYGKLDGYVLTDDEIAALTQAVKLSGYEPTEEKIASWLENDTITLNMCKSGREVVWLMLESTSICLYVDTLEKLDDLRIQEELIK